MRGTGIRLLTLLLGALVLPTSSFAGETIRLKQVTSVYLDEKGNGLSQPEGVACGDDRLVVADSDNGRLVLYGLKDGDVSGGREIKIPQIVYPFRTAVGSKGDIFVLDGKSRKVVRLNPDGTFNRYVELGGLPTESIVVPAGIGIDGHDNLAVLDVGGARVLVFDAEGKLQRAIPYPAQYGFITDITVGAQGTVFLVDSVAGIIYSTAKDPAVFSAATAALKDDMKFAGGLTSDSSGMLYVTDQNSGALIVIGPDGTVRSRQLSFGWKEGMVRYPAQICIDKSGDIFIADRANSRIQEFSVNK